MKVRFLLSGINVDRSSIRLGRCPFKAERWVQIPYGSKLIKGGSSMAEHLTENQKKRVRFSPSTYNKNKV